MKIFMIGTQRSGSNLLRLMLNQAPDIAAPHPPHLLERFTPLLAAYGDLSVEHRFVQLVDDVCRLIEANPVSWGVTLDRGEVRARCLDNSLVAVFGAVMDAMAEQKGKASWLCKSLANVHHLDDIERYFGEHAYYLYLHRDGRDVTASFLKAIVGPKTAYHIAKQWHEEQQLALRCGHRIKDGRFLALSYEELTGRPEPTLRRLCTWLGIDFSPAMLDYHQSEEALRTASSGRLWANVVKPVMATNTAGWREKLTMEDIRVFETVAGASLESLGYTRDLVTPGREAPLAFSVEDIVRFERLNAERKQEVIRTSPEEVAARQAQELVLSSVRAYADAA